MRDASGELLAFIKDEGLGEEVTLEVFREEERYVGFGEWVWQSCFGDAETERCFGDEDTERGLGEDDSEEGLGDKVRHKGLDEVSWLGCGGREKALVLPATPVAWMTLVCLLCSSLVSELQKSNGTALDCVRSIEHISGLLEKQPVAWSICEEA